MTILWELTAIILCIMTIGIFIATVGYIGFKIGQLFKDVKELKGETIGCFKYDLKEHEHEVAEFGTYDAFFNYNMAIKQLGEYEDANEPRLVEEWSEDYGDCLWWSFPIEEPPYCGTPLDCKFPNHVTHFTRLMLPIGESEIIGK